MVGEIAEAQDLVVQEATEVLDTEGHVTTEALDTEDHATTETLDIAVQEMTEAQDLVVQETTEAQDTIKVHLDSKETELQFTVETILKQQDINKIAMSLTEKIPVIVIHFILLLEPNYLLY